MTDRIEKQVVLRAPVARVWRALTEPQEFGQWFGVQLRGAFRVGEPIVAVYDASHPLPVEQIQAYQKTLGLEPSPVRAPTGDQVFCTVVRMDAPSRFSFRWIPYGIDAAVDPATEPTTLVEFSLEAVADGTRLTITESGFDQVPAHRRHRAFLMDEAGWAQQVLNVVRHVQAG